VERDTLHRPRPMSDDTPETTNALHGVWYRGDHGSAIPALCRRLEIERDKLRSENELLRAANSDVRRIAEERNRLWEALRKIALADSTGDRAVDLGCIRAIALMAIEQR